MVHNHRTNGRTADDPSRGKQVQMRPGVSKQDANSSHDEFRRAIPNVHEWNVTTTSRAKFCRHYLGSVNRMESHHTTEAPRPLFSRQPVFLHFTYEWNLITTRHAEILLAAVGESRSSNYSGVSMTRPLRKARCPHESQRPADDVTCGMTIPAAVSVTVQTHAPAVLNRLTLTVTLHSCLTCRVVQVNTATVVISCRLSCSFSKTIQR